MCLQFTIHILLSKISAVRLRGVLCYAAFRYSLCLIIYALRWELSCLAKDSNAHQKLIIFQFNEGCTVAVTHRHSLYPTKIDTNPRLNPSCAQICVHITPQILFPRQLAYCNKIVDICVRLPLCILLASVHDHFKILTVMRSPLYTVGYICCELKYMISY